MDSWAGSQCGIWTDVSCQIVVGQNLSRSLCQRNWAHFAIGSDLESGDAVERGMIWRKTNPMICTLFDWLDSYLKRWRVKKITMRERMQCCWCSQPMHKWTLFGRKLMAKRILHFGSTILWIPMILCRFITIIGGHWRHGHALPIKMRNITVQDNPSCITVCRGTADDDPGLIRYDSFDCSLFHSVSLCFNYVLSLFPFL